MDYLNDKCLSLELKGFVTVILNQPNKTYNLNEISKIVGLTSRKTYNKLIELRYFGYEINFITNTAEFVSNGRIYRNVQ